MSVDEPPGVNGPTVRYVTNVGPADVGERVVLRYRLPGGGLTDVLGVLTRWADGRVTMATRHGEVEVAEADLVAGKRIPPPPVRR